MSGELLYLYFGNHEIHIPACFPKRPRISIRVPIMNISNACKNEKEDGRYRVCDQERVDAVEDASVAWNPMT